MDDAEIELELKLENIPSGSSDAQTKKQELTTECELLIESAKEMGARVNLPEITTSEGARGVEIAIGTIILTIITTESIRLLFQYIKNRIESGFQKDYNYEIVLNVGGERKSLEFRASNFTEKEISALTEKINEFIGYSKGG